MINNIPFYLENKYIKISTKHGLFHFDKHLSRNSFYRKSGFSIYCSFYTVSIDSCIFYPDL